MGLNLFRIRTTTPTPTPTTWTFFLLLCSSCALVDGDRGLLQDLGLDALPDVTKVNISIDEYTNMMSLYLRQLKDSSSSDDTSIPKLYTFNSEKKTWRRWNDDEEDVTIRLTFPSIQPSMSSNVVIDNAEMKLLVPPQNKTTVKVRLYQVLSTRRRRFLREREIFVSPVLNKWCELDVTDVVKNWISGDRNLGIELQCKDCKGSLEPLRASITALIRVRSERVRRATQNLYFQNRKTKTDCVGSRRKKCCRHEMNVTFKDLDLTQMESIIQPKSYEAGFCRGRCPVNFNHATNHSRIQSLVHRRNKTAMPKVCCAPSKLEPLEILRINPADTQKLMIEKWDNMRVVECACS